MIIPREIHIGTRQYEVLKRWQPDAGRVGRINYFSRTIVLNTAEHTGRRRSPYRVAQTFWHEVVHGILYDMGRKDLCDNEIFVQQLAIRLNQIVHSAVLP